jgi:hypothetical protein
VKIEIDINDSDLSLFHRGVEVRRMLLAAHSACESRLLRSLDAGDRPDAERFEAVSDEMEQIIPLLERLYEQARAAVGVPQYIRNGLDIRAKLYLEGGWRHPKVSQLGTTRVFLRFKDGRVVCERCALQFDLVEQEAVAWFAINVIPYSQDCHHCGAQLVKGWQYQLFEKPDPRRIQHDHS